MSAANSAHNTPESSSGAQAPCRVLAVDDSEDDLFFLKRALGRNSRFACVAMLTSGQEALRFFRREPPFSDSNQYPFPDLLFLDLKMPGLNGFAVLEFLQRAFPQRSFKVVVLTSSSAPADERLTKELGADAFITKPAEFAGYVQLLKDLEIWTAGRHQSQS
jgi:CheY-like chemotaxis protein